MSLIIVISTIPRGGIRRSVSKGRDWFNHLLPADKHRDFSVDDINVDYTAERVNEKVVVSGTIQATLVLVCCRCLENFRLPVSTSFRYIYQPEDDAQATEHELQDEELEWCFYHGDTVDISERIVEQIVLQVPMKPLCDENCKGICPVCGGNRNVTACHHEEETTHSPFDALKNLSVKKGNS